MKFQLLVVLLLFGICLASQGQGIDEEKVYPDSEEIKPNYEEDTVLEGGDSQNYAIPEKLKTRFLNLKNSKEIIIKLNKGVDKVLGFVSETFKSLGANSIPLPEISKPFGHPPYGGTFNASKGYFKDPASLVRTGDVEILVRNGTVITLQVQLGFKVAEVGFEEYHLDVLNIHHRGEISVSAEQNSVALRLTLEYAPVCSFHLDQLEFNKLSGIKINITGLAEFQIMFNELSSWLISNFELAFKQKINKVLYDTTNKSIKNKDICKYFPK
ncbi:uncharacterized protein [Rhodnius prolixus]|uniref:Putative secreted protein n=1 Tax=Rhodnius prolixus TaxID=13249 RepID=R4FQJ7_RHOPR